MAHYAPLSSRLWEQSLLPSYQNSVHWVLDIALSFDESRVRAGEAAHNLAVLRHIALNLLRQESTAKVGVKTKRRNRWLEQ